MIMMGQYYCMGQKGVVRILFFPPTGPSVGMADVPSMVLDGLPSCGAKGLGAADPQWSYFVGVVSAQHPVE